MKFKSLVLTLPALAALFVALFVAPAANAHVCRLSISQNTQSSAR